MTTAAKFFAALSVGLVVAWAIGLSLSNYLMAALCSILLGLPIAFVVGILLYLRGTGDKAVERVAENVAFACILFVYPRWGIDMGDLFILTAWGAVTRLLLELMWPDTSK